MMGVLGSEAELSRWAFWEAKRSCLVMMGVLGGEAELGCEVNERFGLTIDDEVREP
jgi:hypothetical protein